jgi:proline iminopeptidase
MLSNCSKSWGAGIVTGLVVCVVAGIAIAIVGACGSPPAGGEGVESAASAPGVASSGGPGALLENGSFYADLDGFNIHYEVHGQGPVLMTVPNSWGLSLEGLRNLYRPLEEHVTMVYFDPRGMGESDPIREPSDMSMEAVRADFDALRRHLDLETVNAIGWSNGAGNLVYLAAELPDTLEAAIFLHGAASYTEEDAAANAEQNAELMQEYAEFQTRMADETLTDEERTAQLKEFWLEEFFTLTLADLETDQPRMREVFDDAEFSWAHADYSQRETPTFDATGLLPQITARSLVITGAHDMLPVQKGEELAAGIAGARFEVFEDSGHFAPIEEPEHFQRLVLEFLGAGQ